MELYTNFLGIDIGKFSFVANKCGSKKTFEFENTPKGIAEFLSHYKKTLHGALCVLETTGGHEMALIIALCKKNIVVHRANTRKVKNFIRSFGSRGKTDALDARALALYGKQRYETLDLFQPLSEQACSLYELGKRRLDLKK